MYSKVADLDVKLERYADAENALEMAIGAHPTRRNLHTRLIDVQLGFLKDQEKADRSTQRFLRLCQPTPRNLLDAGRVYYSRDSWLSAAELGKHAAARADTMIAAHALVGNAYWRAGYPDTGLAYLAGPLERYADEPVLWVIQGSLQIGAGRFDAALQSLARALEIDSDNYPAHRARMMALFRLERYEDSLAEAELCHTLTDSEDELRFLRMHANRVRDAMAGGVENRGRAVEGGTPP